ncbi:MAG: type II secretion system protein [Deltaproteobacteria bacterium]|nr:MAG: type II secretion system protein [Deltaproteobacteria bacterium]
MGEVNPKPETRNSKPLRKAERGFTLIVLVFAILVIGISLGGVGTMWSTAMKREKEAELLFRGDAIRKAIESYYNFTNNREHPRSLDDLLKDPRSLTPKRHLRKLYRDVVNPDGEWELILDGTGGIKGVRSKSKDGPLKKARFPDSYQSFETASTYNDWKFVFEAKAQSGAISKSRPYIHPD